MTGPADEALLSRLLKVQRERRSRAYIATVSNIVLGQLLFASFAFGYVRGPGPIAVWEIAVGVAAALALSLTLSFVLSRRRRERGASWTARLLERNKPCRVVRFSDYVTIGDEIVLDEAVQRAERDGERLMLRYLDPRFSGPVLRELEGESSDLDRLRAALSASPPAAAEPSVQS